MQLPPDTPLARALGKGASRLERHLGLTTVKQLLDHLPRRYIDANALSSFTDLDEGDHVTFVAEVVNAVHRPLQRRRGFIAEVTVEDAEGNLLRMAYFNGYQARRELHAGVRALFHGKVTTYKGQLTLNNPVYEIHGAADQAPLDSAAPAIPQGPMPLYAANSSVTSWEIKRCIDTVLDLVDFSTWPDPVPSAIAEAEGLFAPERAYRAVHQPADHEEIAAGWLRFRCEEALILQGVLSERRREAAERDPVVAPLSAHGVLAEFDARLPFALTEGQLESGAVISADLAGGKVMNRMLQGEVGSGKTLVALRAMLQVFDAGAQTAFVAPTELLAVQHYRSLQAALGELADNGLLTGAASGVKDRGVRLTLLTGSMRTAQRRQALLDIASGEAGIVVGTHALFSDQVQFAQLGLVVVDEQHRFGVEQRSALRLRYTPTPHMLVMSATPIPRSVAMTVFGDLELTVLRGLPAGRSPIDTHVVPLVRGPAWIRRVWQRAAEQIHAGYQVYVVCPRITASSRSEDDISRQLVQRFGIGPGADHAVVPVPEAQGRQQLRRITRDQAVAHIAHDASVELITERLRQDDLLTDATIQPLHGQMTAEQTAETMEEFATGEADVLVATTVVEVGVDVPNATTMIILDADAFGVSTLHQLRGRIGRGQTQANLCLLVTRMPEDHPAVGRLRDVAEHSDGMELARLDLQRRREGDVLGAVQSGRGTSLKHLRIIRDEELIGRAAQYVNALTEDDPQWAAHPEFATAVQQWSQENGDAVDLAVQG